jgi:hypothetical protein
MKKTTKKWIFAFLILIGFLSGYWLAKENTELVRLLFPSLQPPQNVYQRPIDMDSLVVGMETWQVKDVLGPPDERNVPPADQNTRRESWVYENVQLNFTNGVLTSWQEDQG